MGTALRLELALDVDASCVGVAVAEARIRPVAVEGDAIAVFDG